MSERERKREQSRLQRVSDRAYAIWLDQGRVHDRDREHWREAENEIIAEEEQEAAKAVLPPMAAAEPAKAGVGKRAA